METEIQIPKGVGYGYAESSGKLIPDKKREKPIPTCRDKKLLPVWNELREDKNFREWEKDFYMQADCLDMLEVRQVDLNNDGQNDFLLMGKNGNLCGATGNCAFWIYEKQGEKYRNLLSNTTDDIDTLTPMNQVRKKSTNGYSDIFLKGHISGYETSLRTYKFRRGRYRESKCLVEYWGISDDKKTTNCKEFFKQY